MSKESCSWCKGRSWYPVVASLKPLLVAKLPCPTCGANVVTEPLTEARLLRARSAIASPNPHYRAR